MAMTMYNPAHPGEILREYLGMVPVGVAAKKAARGAIHAVAAAERPGLVYGGDGAAAL
jgi:plasmid maintenance system antidote protein VapI